MFWESYINGKIEEELKQHDGFADIFMKCIEI